MASADIGECIDAGYFDGRISIYDEYSSTPVWDYVTDYYVCDFAVTADGEHQAAGSKDNKVYGFKNTASRNGSGNDPPAVWNLDVGPNPAYEGDRVYFSAEWNDTDGLVVAFEWVSDIDGLLSTDGSFDSDMLSVGKNTISFRVQDDGGAWSSWALLGLDVLGQEEDSDLPWNYTSGSWMHSVAVSADGEYIAAGSRDNKVYLFDKDSSTPLWSYTTESDVLSVAISKDGEYIAAGSDDNKVYFFGKDSSTPLWNYTTGDIVLSVSISADGEYIAAGSRNGRVYLFDKDSSTPRSEERRVGKECRSRWSPYP